MENIGLDSIPLLSLASFVLSFAIAAVAVMAGIGGASSSLR